MLIIYFVSLAKEVGRARAHFVLRSQMAGLVSNAGAFFTFYLLTLSGYFALAAFFRLLGTICSSYDVAARLASVLITGMVLYSVSIPSSSPGSNLY